MLLLKVFLQRKFVAHFLTEKCSFIPNKSLCVFQPPFRGLTGNIWCSPQAHWKACSGLSISVNWTFFARCQVLEAWTKTSGTSTLLYLVHFRAQLGVEPLPTTMPLTTFNNNNPLQINKSKHWKHIYFSSHIQTLYVTVLAMVVLTVTYSGHLENCYAM